MAPADSRLANRILLGLIVGAAAGALMLVIGSFAPGVLDAARGLSTAVLDPFGQIFLRLLFFVVIPLVFASLAAGVAQLGRLSDLGPLAGRTFALFVLNMAIGVALGLVMMNVLNPGGRLDEATQAQLTREYGGAAQAVVQVRTPEINFDTLVQMFMPRNLFGAFVGDNREALGEMLPLILFAILVGAAAAQLSAAKREQMRSALEIVAELMTGIVHFALRLAPYAVPAMIFSVVVKVGLDVVIALGLFVLGCLLVMALHLFGTMSIWLKVGARRSPIEFFRKIAPVLVTAFSTSSSNATLPTSLATARESLAIRPSTAGFVLPLGATVNMSGTALYEGCVVLFVAQVFGVELAFSQQLMLLLLAVLSAIAVAGIPGGSLPLIAGLLVTFGIPAEGIGIVLGADRLLDMARTTVNVGADLVTAALVDERMPAGSSSPG
ncbi:MAG: dicarboxylate/amino acid:cation symporter [Steroidobacteraceae bacterium]|jgi:DAACS family dicarboxylate/amino acid:cation (Na+ or H+) symporter|nr:dicarboxylate/amino acid:cation symporter [Steroidobacteraceae bacterium]